ncbi:MAG: class I SAM-dependent methyltransferase, partial [Pseudomonadota bacterium]
MATDLSCPLCGAPDPLAFATIRDADRTRDYFRCATCALTFLAPDQRPTPDEERAQYDLHKNDPQDPAYRNFLTRIANPLMDRLKPGARGLDYGCGPGPALMAMLNVAGFPTVGYDPIYATDDQVLDMRYDFVTCTETAEHFHNPAREFEKLADLLEPGGLLAVMTSFQTDDARFENWHYRKDPTHVVFYRAETFAHLARR